MKIVSKPLSVNYQAGILFINASSRMHIILPEFIKDGSDICVMLDAHFIYISLELEPLFSVFDFEANNFYGPYTSPLALIGMHLFGKYDNVLFLLSDCLTQDRKTDETIFSFESIKYSRFAYDLDSRVASLGKRIAAKVRPIGRQFTIEIGKVYYAEYAIASFLNKLDFMFNRTNFPQKIVSTDYGIYGTVDRNSGDVAGSTIVLNNNSRRHLKFLLPSHISVDYIEFGSTEGDKEKEFLDEFKDSLTLFEVTNLEQITKASELFGIDIEKKTLSMLSTEYFRKTLLIVPGYRSQFLYYFTETSSGEISIIRFDLFAKTMTFVPKENLDIVGEVTFFGSKIHYSSVGEKTEPTKQIAISLEDGVYFEKDGLANVGYGRDGNIYASTYIKNLLKNIK